MSQEVSIVKGLMTRGKCQHIQISSQWPCQAGGRNAPLANPVSQSVQRVLTGTQVASIRRGDMGGEGVCKGLEL